MTWFLRVGATGFEPATSAPKALDGVSETLGFQAISKYLRTLAYFLKTTMKFLKFDGKIYFANNLVIR